MNQRKEKKKIKREKKNRARLLQQKYERNAFGIGVRVETHCLPFDIVAEAVFSAFVHY